MKRLLIPFASLAFLLCFPLLAVEASAQRGTANSGAVIRVSYGANSRDFYAGACGYGTANWGGTPTGRLCASAAWAYDITPDSLCCDSIPADQLKDKIAIIRRGVCAFAVKALNAQKAGALAVLIANHYLDPAQNACSVMSMGAALPQADQTTIPVFFMSRQMAEYVDAALKSGQPVQICIIIPEVRLVNVFMPTSSKQTPVHQIPVDTFGFAARLANTSGVNRTNVVLRARVLTANDSVLFSTQTTLPSLADTVTQQDVNLPGFYAPELPIGTYKILYTVNSDPVGGIMPAEGRVETNFYVTSNLFAKDDGATIAYRPGSSVSKWAVATLYTTNPKVKEKYRVKDVEFAFTTNSSELPISRVRCDLFLFRIKDDVRADYSNFDATQFESESFQWVGTAGFEANASTQPFALQKVSLIDVNSANIGVNLDNGARYVLATQYSDSSALTFHAFDEDLPLPAPSTMVYTDRWYLGGFQGGPSAVLRMYMDLVVTTDEKPLPETVMQVLPNPVMNGQLMLQMGFERPTDATITIAEMSGRVITYETRDALTNDLLTYPLPNLAPGTYLVRVATDEGTLTKKFVLQR
ncbi:MAG: T9SS type A sorting domain-containing protein [Saprospiraceae bacterium]|nr:T9SS type A sorting domain-containing protein [Saprospiraceae bacterium]MDW8484588.1 PA domain-containing protein [Saprospiraceae bacterium]